MQMEMTENTEREKAIILARTTTMVTSHAAGFASSTLFSRAPSREMKLDPKESKRADLSQKRFCAIAAKIHNESDDIRHALRQAAQAATRQYLKAARLPAPSEVEAIQIATQTRVQKGQRKLRKKKTFPGCDEERR